MMNRCDAFKVNAASSFQVFTEHCGFVRLWRYFSTDYHIAFPALKPRFARHPAFMEL
jgi:hypothetical protein